MLTGLSAAASPVHQVRRSAVFFTAHDPVQDLQQLVILYQIPEAVTREGIPADRHAVHATPLRSCGMLSEQNSVVESVNSRRRGGRAFQGAAGS